MTRHHRRPTFGTCKPFCETLDARALLSGLGPSLENPPAEIAEPGELGPTLQLIAVSPASGTTTSEAVSQLRLQFDRPLDDFSIGTSVRLDRLDDGSTLAGVAESLDPDDPSIFVLDLDHALAPGSYRLTLVAGSLLSGLDGAVIDTLGGDQIATEFTVAEEQAPEVELGTLGGDLLTVPGALDLASNPSAIALYRVQISPAHAWWRVGIEVSTRAEGSTLKPVLALYSEDGRLLRVSETGRPDTPTDPYLFAGLPAGTYLIGISGDGNEPGAPGGYNLATGAGGFAVPGAGTGGFTLSLVAEPAEAPTSVLGLQLNHADRNSSAPTGFTLQFSGPMAPSDPSLTGRVGLEVVDARGRVWPLHATSYNETNARLDVLLDQRLPAGSYTIRLAASGGLTDLAGVPPVRAGLPAGELGRFLVETTSDPADPLDLGALFPVDLAGGGVSRPLSLDPGATSTIRLVVLREQRLRFTFDAALGAQLRPESGGDGLNSDALATRPWLAPGVYVLTLSNTGGEAIAGTIRVESEGTSSESLLLNGMGQGSALNLRLVAPSGGLSTAMPSAASPGPGFGTQLSGTNPAAWTGALLGLLPGPASTPSSGDDASTAPLTTTAGPQSAGGLALGLNAEIVGAPLSQPALVALTAPSGTGSGTGMGTGNGMGQGIDGGSALVSFPGDAAAPKTAADNALALAVDGDGDGNAARYVLGSSSQGEAAIGTPLTIVRLDAASAAIEEVADTGESLAGEARLSLLDSPAGDGDGQEDEEPAQFSAIDPCLALTAATVVAIQFRDRIRRRLGRGAHRMHARPVPPRWRHGFAPKVLQN